MWNKPSKAELSKVPKLYETENIKSSDKLIFFHFFISGTDWYIAEYESKDDLFFGFTILNNDYQNAEWGYFSLDELHDVRVRGVLEVDRDLCWVPKKTRDIDKIRSGFGRGGGDT